MSAARFTGVAAALVFALSGVPALSAAPPVLLAAAEHGAAGTDAHADDHDPRYDSILDIKRYDLGLWTLIVFLLLFFVLRRFAWGPIQDGLNKRQQTILSALEEAHKARDEAAASREQLQRELAKANEQVRALLDEARRDAQATKDQMLADARGEIQQERERARREVDIARDQALQDLYQQSVNLAALLSAKTIQRNLSPDDHRLLIDEALADIRGDLNRGVKT